MARSEQVVVLVRGRYNNPEHRCTGYSEPGETILVAGGWYARELMEQGLVASAAGLLTEQQALELELARLSKEIDQQSEGGEPQTEGEAVKLLEQAAEKPKGGRRSTKKLNDE